MSLRRFTLVPFRGAGCAPDIRIAGSIGRRARRLSIRCAIRGDLSELAIPPPDGVPRRKKRLWEETCLEFFLGERNSGEYREFNLSPAGHWNVYRFTSYRAEMREDPAFASLPFRLSMEPQGLALSMDLDIGRIAPGGKTIEAGVGAVIMTVRGEASHWALVHPGSRPDFHRRDGFTLDLPASP